MKYVSFTFDDGRRDNFTYAYPVMKKYGIPGTLFCTTGYIDGTWQKDESWHRKMKRYGDGNDKEPSHRVEH